jgi:L-ascorbate metabolism protein UlaG (beta-lactamase superfamily)
MNMPENRIRIAPYGASYEYGKFTVTMFESRHVPLSWNASLIGVGISAPLVPPARASAYLEGGSYSVLIEHPNGSALVQGSAGYIDGALDELDVDVVFLGIGALGTKDDAYIDGYWDALVETTKPERLIPIHFEDFTWPVATTQSPMPTAADDLTRTFEILVGRTEQNPQMTLELLPYLQPVVLFPGVETTE